MDLNNNITLKRHARARHVKIKASTHRGIEVIVPKRFNEKELPKILEQNKLWIEKHLKKIQEALKKSETESFPEEFYLQAIDQRWKIFYIKTNAKDLRLTTRMGNEIVLLGNSDNKKLCKKLLVRWLTTQAKQHLIPLLENISQDAKLPFNEGSVRAQRTRWGSCSSTKNISLNIKLLFFPPHLTRHVLLHELSHTVHMNHSRKFWRLLAELDPDWRKHHLTIRKEANTFFPSGFF